MSEPMNGQSFLVILVAEQESIKKSPPHRSKVSVDRLERLRSEILSGSYHVGAERLSDAMLRSQGLLKKPADVSFN